MKKSLVFFLSASTLLLVASVFFFTNNPQTVRPEKKSAKAILMESNHKMMQNEIGDRKCDKPEELAQIMRNLRIPDGKKKAGYKTNFKLNELALAKKRAKNYKKRDKLPWIERGPGNVGGRTRGLVVDPDDASGDTWYAGSVSGGIWKTTDAGGSWENLTPDLPNLATVTLDMATTNHDVIYAGTGELVGGSGPIIGDGIFKTTDRGQTWQQLESTVDNDNFHYVSRIIVDPEDENTVLASTDNGIFKTTDGGTSWKQVYEQEDVRQIIPNPENFNVIYAGVTSAGIAKSTDRGETWEIVSMGVRGRVEITISPSNTDLIYAVDRDSYLYISEDAGETWFVAQERDADNVQFLGAQGNYNNALAVNPFDQNIIYIGGQLGTFKVEVGETSGKENLLKAYTDNTDDFLTFVNFGADYLGGGMNTGDNEGATDLTSSDWVSVEIRFGSGKKQKAHRFTVPDGEGPGVPVEDYTYQDYVEVPFEVWDLTNNRQLMVSFRDQERDGKFNLLFRDENEVIKGREYIFVNVVEYDAAAPSDKITKTGGHAYKQIYFLWPTLPEDATWEPNKLPDSKIAVELYKADVKQIYTEEIAHWSLFSPGIDGEFKPYTHADHHKLTVVMNESFPAGFRIIDCNDGGFGISDDGGETWDNPLNGYNTVQFYDADKHPNEDIYFGGTQDNGTFLSEAQPDNLSEWEESLGGDGFEVAWHNTDGNKLIGSLYYNEMHRSDDGGESWRQIGLDIEDFDRPLAPFITQIEESRLDPDLIFAIGKSGIWRSYNFGTTWELGPVENDGLGFVPGTHPQVAASKASNQIVWGGARMSDLGSVYVSTDGGFTYNATSNYEDAELGLLSGIGTHPTQDSTAFVCFSIAGAPKILRTTDLGQTWQDITGFHTDDAKSNNGFPDVAVYSVLVMPHNTDEIWAGTEIGLFISDDNGESWHYADNGLPAVTPYSMRVVGNQVVIGTHGRGVWSAEIEGLSEAETPDVVLGPNLINLGQNARNNFVAELDLREIYDSIAVYKNDEFFEMYEANAEISVKQYIFPIVEMDTTAIYAIAYKEGTAYRSNSIKYMPFELLEPKNEYYADFNSGSTDFELDGFAYSLTSGFSNKALQTLHPYDNGPDNSTTDFIAMLKVPIIVREEAAFMDFREIALVEPGDDGTSYGEFGFWDYVIVEASKDMVNWIPLTEGYDCTKHSDWETLYNSAIGGDGTSTALGHKKYFKLNVLSLNADGAFVAGDEIIIRFRLNADEASRGWGWIVDDLRIQGEANAITNNIGNEIKLSVFPNPTNGYVNISTDFGKKVNKLNISVLNASGQLVKNRSFEQINGLFTYKLDLSELPKGYYFLKFDADGQKTTKKVILQ